MLNGRSFVAHIVFAITAEGGAPTIIRNDFHATIARTAAGIYTVTMDSDTAEADACPIVSTSPAANAQNGNAVFHDCRRASATTWEIQLYVAAGAPPADPAAATIVRFSLDRVDTV